MRKELLTVATCLILLITGCSRQSTVTEKIQTVRTDTVRSYGERAYVTYPGKVRAAADVNLAFRVSGTIAKVYVDVGAYVKKGQILAEIDARDYEIQLAATDAEYKRIESEVGRIVALYEKGAVTPNDYDKAVYGLKQISAKYQAHLKALDDVKLRAPFDGYIQKRLFDSNETIAAGTPVVSIISGDIPEVEVNIPASDFIRRDKFESFVCRADIYPDKQFSLDMAGIAQKANLNQLYNLRLKMRRDDGELPPPGTVTMVSIYFKTDGERLTSIPISALFEINGLSTVWIYNNNSATVEQRTVKILKILNNGTAVVDGGLEANEIIVSAGVHSLRQGEKVKLLPPVSTTNIGGLL